MVREVRTVLDRELRSLEREVRAYPTDEAVWVIPEGVRNSGGTLVLHLVGNLRWFVGGVLGGSGYERDREAEFGTRGVSREDLAREIAVAREEVAGALDGLPDARLSDAYPLEVNGVRPRVGVMLLHLATHLAFHVGQVDYHRRLSSGSSDAVEAVALSELVDPR